MARGGAAPLIARLSKSMSNLALRLAEARDCEQIFAWRNDPFIIAKGSSARTVLFDEHVKWFQANVGNSERRLQVVEIASQPAGLVRFDLLNKHEAVISIYLTESFTGKGYGTEAIRQATDSLIKDWGVSVIACVRNDNAAGTKVFLQAGYIAAPGHAACPAGHVSYIRENQRTGTSLQISEGAIPHNRLTHGAPEIEAISRVVASGHWAMGSEVSSLETELAARTKWADVACVGSGLAALRLALLGLGVGEGDEVVIPAYACVALPNAILACGARPVIADVLPQDWNIDPAAVKRVVTPRIKAIIAVHTFGMPADIAALKKFGPPVIEDCAHGFAPHRMADVAITSFYATKMIGGGEGGAVLADDRKFAADIRRRRDYTDCPPGADRLNDKMTNLSGALARCQLDRLDALIARRAALAAAYNAAFKAISGRGVILPKAAPDRVWYRYTIETKIDAEALVAALAKCGVTAASPVWDWRSAQEQKCPVADGAYRRIVSLPLYPSLTGDEQRVVIEAVIAAVGELKS